MERKFLYSVHAGNNQLFEPGKCTSRNIEDIEDAISKAKRIDGYVKVWLKLGNMTTHIATFTPLDGDRMKPVFTGHVDADFIKGG